jgi:hypothetical protein
LDGLGQDIDGRRGRGRPRSFRGSGTPDPLVRRG